MTAVPLTENTSIIIEGVLHKIVSWAGYEKVFLKSTSDGEVAPKAMSEIFRLIDAGKATIKTVCEKDAVRRARLEKNMRSDLDALPKSTREAFERRFAYVKAISDQMPIAKNRANIEPILAASAQRLNDPKPPSFATACRWLRDYEAAGKDPRGLIPSFDARGNRERRLNDRVLEIIQDAIQQEYLNQLQGSPKAVLREANLKIQDEELFKPGTEELALVDIRAVYREIAKLDTYQSVSKRLGKSIADKMFRGGRNAPKATRPLERVEIDHTVLDLFLVDEETGMLAGRPTITVAIDCYTRSILGFYIGFEPPGWQAVMHCLRNAISPNNPWRERFPSINGSLNCYGVPETIVVDNGREFHSKDFLLACAQLGVEIQYSPRAKPWFKGKVERIFRTIGTDLLTGTRGKAVSKLLQEKEYDPQKDAVVGMNRLTEAFCKWVVDVYSHEYHAGIECTPAEMWERGLEEFSGIRIPSSLAEFLIVMSSSQTRTIQHYGIELNNIRYKSEDLSALRQKLHKRKNPSVCVKYDPSDLGYIRVQDPEDGSYIVVPAEDLEYASGTNYWQNKVICRWRYRQQKQSRQDMTLAEARHQIQAMLNEAKIINLPAAASSRVARFNGTGSNRLLGHTHDTAPDIAADVDAPSHLEDEDDFSDMDDDDSGEWKASTNANYPR
jgi:putative transposase